MESLKVNYSCVRENIGENGHSSVITFIFDGTILNDIEAVYFACFFG